MNFQNALFEVGLDRQAEFRRQAEQDRLVRTARQHKRVSTRFNPGRFTRR